MGKRYSLRLLRVALGKTLAEISEAVAPGNDAVAMAEENLGEVSVSLLERYASALGGVLEIAVVVHGRRYILHR